MGIIKELKAFMTRGSVVDMAVGIIIGAAFGKIVSSLVSDVIMPPVGVLLSGMDFTDMKFILKEATANTTAVTINYGQFTQTIIDFLIIATAIFFVIKGINSFNKKTENEENKPAEASKEEAKPTKEEELLTEIRDLLKKS